MARDFLLPVERSWLLTYGSHRPGLPVLFIEIGQFGKALACFENVVGIVTTTMGEIRVGQRRARILIRMGRPAEVLDWARTEGDKADTRGGRYVVKLMEVRALVALGSMEAARLALTEFRSMVAEGTSGGAFFHIRAEIALAESDPEVALEALREWNQSGRYRVGGLDDIEFREMMARAHYMAGRLDKAAKVHEEMLRVYRGHFLSHYELGLIYDDMGRAGDAEREYTAFLSAWAEADEGLPPVLDTQRRLDALKAASN